jgi:hypothetical protein
MSNIAWPGQETPASRRQSTPDVVEVHIRADKKLDPVAAAVLVRTFRRPYDDIVAGNIRVADNGADR